MRNEIIYLRNKIEILYKYKWIVLIVPVVSLLIAGAIIVKAKSIPPCEVYEAIAIIQDGFIKGPIIKKEQSWEQFKFNAGDSVKRIQFEDIKNTSYFKLKFQGDNAELVKAICEKISKDYIADVKVFYDQEYSIYADQKRMLEKDKEFSEKKVSWFLQNKKDRIEILFFLGL